METTHDPNPAAGDNEPKANLTGDAAPPEDPQEDIFEQTRWSRVYSARDGDEKARNELAAMYETALMVLANSFGYAREGARDVVQAFFLRHFWRAVEQASNAEKKKLRAFLYTAFRSFCIDNLRRENAAQRGGGQVHFSIDAEGAPEQADLSEDEKVRWMYFDREWAISLWERVFEAASRRWGRTPQHVREFHIYEQNGLVNRDFSKLLSRPDYAAIAAALGLNERTAEVRVTRFCADFKKTLQREVWQTLAPTGDQQKDEAALTDEVNYLIGVLRTIRTPIPEDRGQA